MTIVGFVISGSGIIYINGCVAFIKATILELVAVYPTELMLDVPRIKGILIVRLPVPRPVV